MLKHSHRLELIGLVEISPLVIDSSDSATYTGLILHENAGETGVNCVVCIRSSPEVDWPVAETYPVFSRLRETYRNEAINFVLCTYRKRFSNVNYRYRMTGMNNSIIVQLMTLWFVILIFIRTGSGAANGLIPGIGALAMLLAYVIPLAILLLLVSILFGE